MRTSRWQQCAAMMLAVSCLSAASPASDALKAAQASMVEERYSTALSHFRTALTTKPRNSLSQLERCTALLDSGKCLGKLLREPERLRTLKAAVAICRKSGSPEASFDARRQYADATRRGGDRAEAIKLQEELLESETQRCQHKPEGPERLLCMSKDIFGLQLDLVQDYRTARNFKAAQKHLDECDKQNTFRGELMPSMSLKEGAQGAKNQLAMDCLQGLVAIEANLEAGGNATAREEGFRRLHQALSDNMEQAGQRRGGAHSARADSIWSYVAWMKHGRLAPHPPQRDFNLATEGETGGWPTGGIPRPRVQGKEVGCDLGRQDS